MPINTPDSAILLFVLGFAYDTKKAQVFASSAYPGIVGLRIALPTQDRQRLSAHANTNYI